MVVRPFFFFSFLFFSSCPANRSLSADGFSFLSLSSLEQQQQHQQTVNHPKIASLSSSYQTTKLSMSSIELLLTFCADSGFASG